MSEERAVLDALLGVVRQYDLDALTVRVGTSTYELFARPQAVESASAAAVPLEGVRTAPPPDRPAAPSAPTNINMKMVTAPIIGVFYRSAAPGTESFVEVGDRVVVGQGLCILEAMKLMNEITSDYAGTVRRILPENGALVSLGEEMFWIEP